LAFRSTRLPHLAPPLRFGARGRYAPVGRHGRRNAALAILLFLFFRLPNGHPPNEIGGFALIILISTFRKIILMGKRDKRVDAIIAKAEPFAQPILRHLRELVHEVCPDVEETIKWGMPHFDYQGVLCSMASFKRHAVFGFWKASLMKDKKLMENAASETSMGHLGKLTSLKDLPSDKILKSYIKEAMELNEMGAKVERTKPMKGRKVTVPSYFRKALAGNKSAAKSFDAFSPSHKKEYVEWITEAKTDATRDKRIETALEWLAEGKPRNWKYMKK
jgi:uncharacterized protein YdeI (YjbR/CyaY-like superfamily)